MSIEREPQDVKRFTEDMHQIELGLRWLAAKDTVTLAEKLAARCPECNGTGYVEPSEFFKQACWITARCIPTQVQCMKCFGSGELEAESDNDQKRWQHNSNAGR